MKQLFPLFSLVIILLFTGCTKEQNFFNSVRDPNSKNDSLVKFLKTKFPDRVSTLNLESITPLIYHNQVLGYQIFEKSNPQKFLAIKKEGLRFSGNWVDLTSFIKTEQNKYSGKIKLSSLSDERTELIIENNKVIKVNKWDNTLSRIGQFYPPQKALSVNSGVIQRTSVQEEVVLPEVIIVMHKEDYFSLYWIFDEYSPFSYYYLLDGIPINGGGITGSGGEAGRKDDNVLAVPVFNGPKTPIKSIQDELKCFTLDSKSSYSVSVNINQPSPNTSDKINTGQEFMAGHVFLTLEQIKGDGSEIVRNVGYYPENNVYPGNIGSTSIFGDDSETPFAVSLKMSVTGEELNRVINSLLNQQSINYNLENFNCVHSVSNALRSINVQLPLTSSGVPFVYYGVNPADLGQDIRNLNLKTFSEKNGNRQMKKTTSNKDDVSPPAKKGSC